MAGKMKPRDFTDLDRNPVKDDTVLGYTSHDVKLPNGNYVTEEMMGPVNFPALVKHLTRVEEEEAAKALLAKEQNQALVFYWRGREAMSAQRVRIANDTVVTIPGTSKSLDLMAIPVNVAVQAINVHDLGIKLLSDAAADMPVDDDEGDEEVDEDTEKLQRKNRAWDNARRFLLESGKAIIVNDVLAVNPDYKVATIKGSSDLDTFLDAIMPEEGKGKRGKRSK